MRKHFLLKLGLWSCFPRIHLSFNVVLKQGNGIKNLLQFEKSENRLILRVEFYLQILFPIRWNSWKESRTLVHAYECAIIRRIYIFVQKCHICNLLKETKHKIIWKNMKNEFFTFETFSATFAYCNFRKPFTSISAIFANNKCQNYSKLKFNFSCFSYFLRPLASSSFFSVFEFFMSQTFLLDAGELLSKKLKLYEMN